VILTGASDYLNALAVKPIIPPVIINHISSSICYNLLTFPQTFLMARLPSTQIKSAEKMPTNNSSTWGKLVSINVPTVEIIAEVMQMVII